MYKYFFLLALLMLSSCSSYDLKQLGLLEAPSPVFISGEENYTCYRIPAIIQAPNGHLLAFCEGRKNSCSDTGNIDLIMKRSEDFGKTWSSIQVIWDDSTNTCGNPVPIVDDETSAIHLLSTWNLGTDREREIIDQTSEDTRHVFAFQSNDNGKTWSNPKEITKDVKLPNWTWYATGPGSGIQLTHPPYSGRLMAGCDHIEAGSKKYYSHIIYSDDHGESWQLGGSTAKDQVNECEVAELPNGHLLLNMRNYDRNQKQRQTAISEDGGIIWKDQKHDKTLMEPICQASLQSFEQEGTSALLFSNPASRDERVKMTVRISYDNGASWPDSLVLHSGPSAYSDLVVLENGSIGCLFESGEESPYERIVYSKMSLRSVE